MTTSAAERDPRRPPVRGLNRRVAGSWRDRAAAAAIGREAAVLIDLCRSNRGAPLIRTEPRVWDRVVDLAIALGLGPWAYARGREAAALPPTAKARLEGEYRDAGLRNLRRYGALRRINSALADVGLPAIVLKGAALAAPVYGDIGLRPMSDLDVLVRPDHLDRADAALRGLGYRPDTRWRSAEWYRTHHHHLAPLDGPAGERVELHHDIVPPDGRFRTPIADFWARAVVVDSPAGPLRVLSPEDQMFHLCLHVAAVDPFSGKLRNLVDIARLAERRPIAWPDLAKRLACAGPEGPGLCALWAAARLAGAPIPDTLLDATPAGGWTTATRILVHLAAVRVPWQRGFPPSWMLESLLGVLLGAKSPEVTAAALWSAVNPRPGP